jgi:purine-binding chemotaxis protein CheW
MEQTTSYLTFKLAGERYAVTLGSLREIIGGIDVVPVPCAPADVTGVVNFRGQIVSIVDFYKRFGLHIENHSQESSTLVLQHGQQLLGLQVDQVEAVVQIDDSQIEPPPAFSQHALLSLTESVARMERQFLVILSTEKIFSIEERNEADGDKFSPSVA